MLEELAGQQYSNILRLIKVPIITVIHISYEFMKVLTRIFLLIILCLLTINASAQSGYFSKYWNFNSIDEVPTKYEVYTRITTKTPDAAAKGQPILLDGDPTKEEVHEFLFKYAEDGYC